MIDRLTAETQARISYGYGIGYFALKLMEGLGWLTEVKGIDELALLIGYFWFQRQRQQETKPNA